MNAEDTPQNTPEDDGPQAPTGPRRITRSRDDRVIGGVCGGLADWLGWSPTMGLILYVIVSIASAGLPGMLVYIILWIAMPEAPAERWT